MNYGLQRKSVINAITYLCELLSNLYGPVYRDINMRNINLMKKYSTYTDINNWYYKNCLPTLVKLHIIYRTDKSYKHNFIDYATRNINKIIKNESQKYAIDIEILRNVMIDYGMDLSMLYTNVFTDNKPTFTQEVIECIDRAVDMNTFDSDILTCLTNNNIEATNINFEHITRLNKCFKRKSKNNKVFGRTLLNCEYTDTEVLYMVYKYSPELRYWDEVSSSFEEFRLESTHHCTPKITRGKNKGWISSIGIRETNSICVPHNYTKHPEKGYLGSREELLDKTFGKNNWDEYDVKGSIFRIERYLNTGDFLPMNEDPYSYIFTDPIFKGVSRSKLKSDALRINFEGSLGSLARHFKRTVLWQEAVKTLGYQENVSILLKWVEKTYRERYAKYLETGYKSVKEFTGMKNLSTKIFLDESIIMGNVRIRLAESGIKTGLVYDCIYCEKGKMPDNIADIIKEEIIKYKVMFNNK